MGKGWELAGGVPACAGMTEGGCRNDGGAGATEVWRDSRGERGMTVEGVERVISVNRLLGLFGLYRVLTVADPL